MQNSIRKALSVRIGIVILCVNILIGVIYFSFSIQAAEKEFNSNIEQQTKHLADAFTQQLWLFDFNTTQRLSKLALDSSEIRGLRIIDKKGITISEDGTFDSKNAIFIKKELRYKEKIIVGYLELSFLNASWQKQRNSLLFAGISMIAITIIMTFLFISFLLNKHLIKPLDNLKKDMISLQKGQFNPSHLHGYKTEIQNIIDVFNDMTITLAQREEGQKGAEKQLKNSLSKLEDEVRERKETEQKMRSLRNLLRNIIDSMPSAIVGVDIDGKVMQWNLEAERVTGIAAEDALGRIADVVYPTLSSEMENIKRAIIENTPIINHKSTNKQMGETVHINITIYPLTTNGISGAVIRIDDITEIEIKDQQLQQAQKMETVGTLAGGLAHDFNNVLGGIVGTLSILEFKLKQKNHVSPEDLSKYVNIMKQAGERASNIVNQLLALSRKQEVSYEISNLNKAIQNIIKVCENSFDKSVKIVSLLPEEPTMISADPTQIEQVLLNFCLNAAQAMTIMKPEGEKWGGVLDISVNQFHADQQFCNVNPEASEQDYWVISISDTGVGMQQSTISQIFTPFFTTKGEGRGTGLGLAMVYNIIKQHNGFIEVHSEPGIGSQFKMYIPALIETELNLQAPHETQPIATGVGCVLVVDDEEIMRMTAQNILEECGYCVNVASSGTEAIEIYSTHMDKINLILLDMAMPEMSGKETFIALKSINPNVNVLLASGYRHDERVEDVLQLGVKDFIQKPYTIEKLALVVEKTLLSS